MTARFLRETQCEQRWAGKNQMNNERSSPESSNHIDNQSAIANEISDIAAELEQLNEMAQAFLTNKRAYRRDQDKDKRHP